MEISELARKYYRQVKPTDYEFLAMLGLIVWSEGRVFTSYVHELRNIVQEQTDPESKNLETWIE